MKGYIHIYCGDGKGKTTAATGLAVRMAGSGRKVLIARFLKNEVSSELAVLREIEDIHVVPVTRSFGFYNRMSEAQKREARVYYTQMLYAVLQEVLDNPYGLLFLDEVMSAYQYELIDRDMLMTFLKKKPESLEVVMTGRNPAEELIAVADYVSEIRKIKHPYDAGISARKGVEY